MKRLIESYRRLFHFRRAAQRPVTVAELLTNKL
ncbi:Uncharacterised protein [Mycobacteroides abscessus subsp. massiliense]|nr:Uncharacterised protein [Mycobacteroides abscessus subsp. massiliense]SKM35413.1 Uncharacterised protein [Mycobacteroides abscessus subsp. massiliense]SKP09248.1 Uncharacterised protein [Mycobacteroides abscessus subsp. massiliense]SKP94866.1 Uncharacterised protein [Mycobacteroides abscessus subsp. massiliense]SLK59490.1 Uncharacterised protein [Mycobacteroides abscessus subsp. massiliense]